MNKLDPFLRRISVAGPSVNVDTIVEAVEYAQQIYAGDQHWTGISVFEHVIEVVEMLAPFEPDQDTIVATLLHHALLAPCGVTLQDVEDKFGVKVRSLVGGIHLLSNVTVQGHRNSVEDLRLMLLSVSDDIRTILVSMCDRCCVLQYMSNIDPEQSKRVASDVLNLYAPVAARLGIYSLKHELERRAFPICYPSDAEGIAEQVHDVHKKTGVFLGDTAQMLQEYVDEQDINVTIEYREKQLYSTFQKMRLKSYSHVENVKDLFAIRVIVNSTEDCYRVLGLLHKLGQPVAHRFKDYIAFPKPNGYQSLHTTLKGLPGVPEDTFVEVQIRTKKMHREALYGIAAHWSYKEHGATRRAMENVELHQILTTQQKVDGPKTEPSRFADHIYVLTPGGDVFEMPEGATPLDFAFQVHTDLGLSFRSATVNDAIVPLDYHLENGDVVAVQKWKTPRPSPQWMQSLKMASSRSKLKRYLFSQRRTEFVVRGRELFNAELAKHSLPPLDSDLSILREYNGEVLPISKREDLLFKIGQEAERPSAILHNVDSLSNDERFSEKDEPKSPKPTGRSKTSITLEDGLQMPIRFAKCCKPDEGKKGPIAGVVGRVNKVNIHRASCGILKQANTERRVKAEWMEAVGVDN